MQTQSGRTPAMLMRSLTRSHAHRVLVAAFLSLVAAGCADVTPPATASIVPAKPPTETPQPAPNITGDAIRYQRVSPLSYGAHDSYLLSLGKDSAFVIIFPNGGTYWGWAGRYSRADSVLDFHFNALSGAGELSARGTLRGDTLVLRYSLIMQLTDFENGTYVRAPGLP